MPANRKLISCTIASVFAQLLLDGRLSVDQRAELDLHISACKSCEELIGDLRRDSGLLASWTPMLSVLYPGDNFNSRILSAISSEQALRDRVVNNSWQFAIGIALASAFCVGSGYVDPANLKLPTDLFAWMNITHWSDLSNFPSFFQIGLKSMTGSWITVIGIGAIAVNLVFMHKSRSNRKDGSFV